MKLFVNERHKRRAIIAHIVMPFICMGVMSWGSYDPREYGFWGSILFSIFLGVTSDYLLVKMKEYSDKKTSSN
jgi:hypothetical protein